MSTIVGAIAQEQVAKRRVVSGRADNISKSAELILPAPRMSFLLLIAIVLLSALSVVYIKDYNRRMFVMIQNMQKEYSTLQTEEGKLLFEQGLIASRTYVQEIAENQLDMQIPMAKDVVMVKA